eukprot:TCONS_00051176-protein
MFMVVKLKLQYFLNQYKQTFQINMRSPFVLVGMSLMFLDFNILCYGQISPLKFCDKASFMEKFIEKAKSPDQETKQFLKQTCSRHVQCAEATFDLMYLRRDSGQEQYFFLVSLDKLDDFKYKGCWGYELEISNEKRLIQNVFINFNEEDKRKYFQHYIPVEENKKYTVTLRTYPIVTSYSLTLKVPGPCENDVLG